MKKRLTLLAAVLALALVLSGCAGKAPQTGTLTPVTPQTEAKKETTAPTETAAPTEADVSLGRMVGGVYENTYTGYGCKLDENWEYYTAEELQDLDGLTDEMLRDTAIMEGREEYHQFTDMMAENVNDLTTMNINYTYMSQKERLAISLFSEEEIIDGILEDQESMADSYAQSGVTVLSMEKTEVTFLGQQRWALYTQASVEDVPYYILQIYDVKPGGSYNVVLTLGSFLEDNTESLLDLFYPVSE